MMKIYQTKKWMRHYGLLATVMLFVVFQVGCGLVYDEEKLLASASQHQKSGDHNSAIIEYKKVLQKNPESKVARLSIADSYLAIQQGDAAEKELRRAISLGVKREDVLVELARSLLMQNKINEIFTETSLNVTLSDEKKAKLQLVHGYAYLAEGSLDKARAVFNQAINNKVTAVPAYIGMSRLASATTDLDKGLVAIEKAINIDNTNGEAWFQRGNINLAMGDLAEAKRSFNNVVKVSPKNMLSQQEFQARLKLSQVGLSQNNIAATKEQVAVLNQGAPNHHMTKYMNAMIAYQEKNYEKASAQLEKVAANLPNFMQAQLLMGAIYFAQGHLEQANEILSRYVTKLPTHIQARKLLGSIRLKLGRHEDALDTLKQAKGTENDVELLAMIGRASILGNDTEQALTYLKRARESDPENQLLREELAKLYLKKGSIDEAIKEIEGISGNQQQQTKSKQLLVYAHLRKQDFVKARELVSQLLAKASTEPENHALAGYVELVAGDRVAARNFFNQALKVKADHVPALMSLARMDLEDSKLATAEQRFKQILGIDANNVNAIMGMANLAGRKNKPDEAVTWLTKASVQNPKALGPRIILSRYYLSTKKANKAIVLLEEAAKIAPKNQTVLVMLTRAMSAAGRKQEALLAANKLVKTWPKIPGAYLELARIQESLNYHQKAIQSLEKALKLKPTYQSALIALVSVHIKHGNSREAMQISTRYQKSHPDQAIGFALEGELLAKEKQYAKAIKAFLVAAKKKPLYEYTRKLSMLYRLSGKTDDGIRVLETWLKSKPEDMSARTDLALIYEQANQVNNAREQYLTILKKSPDNIAAINNLSLLYLDSDLTKALELAERAHKLKPNSPAIADTLGWVLLKAKNPDRALSILQDAAKKSQNPSIQYHYAVALNKTGSNDQAKQVLENVLAKKIDFPEKATATKLLDTVSR